MEIEIKDLAKFLFEIGTLRKTARAHRQTLLTDDLSDNIASHSNRTTSIGIFLAILVGADVGKVAVMCNSHDWPETRSGDHNWVHKKNVRVDTLGIILQQFSLYKSQYVRDIVEEYEKRESKESMIAKDADTIDQLLLLKEYEMVGNKEAVQWLAGRSNPRPYAWCDRMKLEISKELGRAIYDSTPSDWWKGIATNENLPFN